MRKIDFRVEHYGQQGEFEIITAASVKAAMGKSRWPASEIAAVIAVRKSPGQRAKMSVGSETPTFTLLMPGGAGTFLVAPSLKAFNEMLNKLGFKSQRVTSNMLNKEAGEFLIDADTPSYCDPGCESYHSM